MTLRRALRACAPAWLLLVAVTLAARVLVPAGYMADRGADGSVRLTLCSGVMPAKPVIAHHAPDHHAAAGYHAAPAHPDKSDPPSKEAQPCAFAVAGAAIDTPQADAPLLPATAHLATLTTQRVSLAPGRGLAAPPPPSRGPPVSFRI
jgi:hypothetical protein